VLIACFLRYSLSPSLLPLRKSLPLQPNSPSKLLQHRKGESLPIHHRRMSLSASLVCRYCLVKALPCLDRQTVCQCLRHRKLNNTRPTIQVVITRLAIQLYRYRGILFAFPPPGPAYIYCHFPSSISSLVSACGAVNIYFSFFFFLIESEYISLLTKFHIY